MLDCIIVGQGIAGTSLGICLEKAGLKTMFIKDKKIPCASEVAAGLIQPISGKFLTSNTLINKHSKSLIKFYKDLEILLDASFFNSTITYLHLTKTQEKIYKKKSKKTFFSDLLQPTSSQKDYSNQKEPSHRLSGCFVVNTNKIFNKVENYFFNKDKLIYDTFDEAFLEIQEDYICYKQHKAKYIIFCTGSATNNLSYFNSLSFQNVKGEILVSNQTNHNINYVIQNDKWCVPITNNEFKLGSTYVHDNHIFPTKNSWQTLLNSIKDFGLKEDSITSIQSGRRLFGENYLPMIGFLKNKNRIGLFSGFGSKGFSFAPIMAQLWANSFPNIPNELLEFNLNK